MDSYGPFDVWFYEAFAEEEAELRRHLPAPVRAGFTGKTVQEAGDADPPAPVISIRTQSQIPTAWAVDLKGILSRTTGYDVPQRYRRETGRDVPSGYLPLYCHRAVAEQAMLLWMALLRRLPRQIAQFERFHRDGLTGQEAEGKNLLVVGAGHIGSEVVKIGRGLGLNVRRVDIIPDRSDVSIEDGLPWAQIVVCAMNLTPDNAGYFHYDRLRRTPRGALFVNIARGELSAPADLRRLLEEQHLGGVALDVYDHEAPLAVALRTGQPTSDPVVQATRQLAARPDVILTPHNAFNTIEAVRRKSEQTAQQLDHFLKQGRFLWPVP
ncbi:hydroxyacid dehydrogenase [bacterium]|nr:hydroxyacid dehydrogenase [bacterium]